MEPGEFQGTIGRYHWESTPWWPEPRRAPADAPNVVLIVLDDVGFAQLGCFGSDLDTPVFDGLAARGLRYRNFHTTALCSPTRSCLLTGRNHHANGMGRITDLATGFPGYDTRIPKANPFLSEMLVPHGYAAWAIGKWHLTPDDECNLGAPRDRWPLGRGFERFYGFFGGETHQFAPALVHDNHFVDAPRAVADGYHLTEDLVDHAIAFVHDLRQVDPDKPFFAYFCPGACHSPHQAPPEWIERYRGRFDSGLGRVARADARSPERRPACCRQHTVLSERPDWVPAWADLDRDERSACYARYMEAFAGYLSHTDHHVGRFLDALADDRRSRTHGRHRLLRQRREQRRRRHRFAQRRAGLELRAAHRRRSACPCSKRSAARAGTTTIRGAGPSPATRRSAGGSARSTKAASPIRSSWPGRVDVAAPGGIRDQYVHAIDVFPTVLELVGHRADRTGRRDQLRRDVRHARRARSPPRAVLRDVRLPRAVPGRLEGRGVPPHPVRRARPRHRRVGAVPRRRRSVRDARPRRRRTRTPARHDRAVVAGSGTQPRVAARQPPLRRLRVRSAATRSPNGRRTCTGPAPAWCRRKRP